MKILLVILLTILIGITGFVGYKLTDIKDRPQSTTENITKKESQLASVSQELIRDYFAGTTKDNSETKNTENMINNNSIDSEEKTTNEAVTQPEEGVPLPYPNRVPGIDGFTDLALEYKGAVIHTNMGDITVEFYAEESPFTVNNFMNLAKVGFYDGTKFHRVIKNFMIQGGDPNSKSDETSSYGTGGPGYKFGDEFNDRPLVRGSLAMANSGPNTNGSQFFIVTAEATPHLDGLHVNFGRVVSGMDNVLEIEKTKTGGGTVPVTPVVVESVTLVR
jgi:cyclophilin family peptidyl-prolyl cis-trans isomerase